MPPCRHKLTTVSGLTLAAHGTSYGTVYTIRQACLLTLLACTCLGLIMPASRTAVATHYSPGITSGSSHTTVTSDLVLLDLT